MLLLLLLQRLESRDCCSSPQGLQWREKMPGCSPGISSSGKVLGSQGPWKLGPGLEGLLGPRDETIVPHGPSLGVRCGSFQALPAPAPPVVLPFSSSLKRLVAVRQGRHCGSVG